MLTPPLCCIVRRRSRKRAPLPQNSLQPIDPLTGWPAVRTCCRTTSGTSIRRVTSFPSRTLTAPMYGSESRGLHGPTA